MKEIPSNRQKIHDLKTWDSLFQYVKSGEKTAEYRKDDRGFKQGQFLNLREWDNETEEYTGESLLARITHIVYGGQFGIPEDYCVMSITIDTNQLFEPKGEKPPLVLKQMAGLTDEIAAYCDEAIEYQRDANAAWYEAKTHPVGEMAVLTDEEIEGLPSLKRYLNRQQTTSNNFNEDARAYEDAHKASECLSAALSAAKESAQAQLEKDKPHVAQARQEGIEEGIVSCAENTHNKLLQHEREETARQIFKEIERERFAEPQHIPQAGREPVIICLTENDLQDLKETYLKRTNQAENAGGKKTPSKTGGRTDLGLHKTRKGAKHPQIT